MSLNMELEDIKRQISNVNETVNEIYGVLIGSEHDKESAFLSRVKVLETQVKALNEFKQRIIYMAIGSSIPTSYGLFKIISAILSLAK